MKNSNRTLFVVLALLGCAPLAQADLLCPQYVPNPFVKIDTQIDSEPGVVITGKNIDCKKIGMGATLIKNVGQMLNSKLQMPSRLIFRMVDTYDNAYFSPNDISLNVPYQLVLGEYAKNPVYGIPIWAHEYGHAVLDLNLRSEAPKWRSQIRRYTARANDDERAYIFETLISSYHEYFADVVAVLYTGAGDAVAKSLYMTGFVANPEGRPGKCPNKDPKCRPRNNNSSDFRVALAPRDFTNRGNQLPGWKGSVDPFDGHNVLAAARFHIFKYYISSPSMSHRKAEIAEIVLESIVDDVNRRMKRLIGTKGEITPEAFNRELSDVVRVNQEFIQTLDAHFEKHGI